MDCETLHLELPDLLYGELDAERKTACDSHTASCTECAELVSELETVRSAQAHYVPSPLLTSRIKLAARDALLKEGESATPPFAQGGSVHVLGTLLLAASVGLVAFALGISYGRAHLPAETVHESTLPVPTNPGDLVQAPQPDWLVEINQPGEKPIQVPRAQTAWQRVLHDAAQARLEKGELGEAREFFLNAASVAPDGPLAAACRVGAAEALLRAGGKAQARDELREVRQKVVADLLRGSPALLQRITELLDEAVEVAPHTPPPPPEDD